MSTSLRSNSGGTAAMAGAPGGPVTLQQDCVTRDDLPVLADLPPTNTLAYIDVGPVVLFSTPHAVLGGPYHRNQAGLKGWVRNCALSGSASATLFSHQRTISGSRS